MLRELLAILRGDRPLRLLGESFSEMLSLTREMTVAAGEIYFGGKSAPEDRTRVYEQDIQVNKLERSIRKQVVAHLTVTRSSVDVPYCLLLMSLVKDVERLGDYAKNLAEVVDVCAVPLPPLSDDEIVQELAEIRRGVEEAFQSASDIFATSDQERALLYIRAGRGLAHRCDALIRRIARADYPAGTTTALVLGTRYYKRIAGHVLNVLSSVVMPLHKIDYYDEDDIVPPFRED